MTQVIDVDGTVIAPTCVHWKVSFTSPESSVTSLVSTADYSNLRDMTKW